MVLNKVILWLVVMIFLSGCSHTYTAKVWQKQKVADTVTHFLITEDSKKIIFVSKQHHYIFDASESLVKILKWSDSKILRVYLSKSFSLNIDNKISGSFVTGAVDRGLTSSQLKWLNNNGFKKASQVNEYTLRIDLLGERFLSNDTKLGGLGKLNDNYLVLIEKDRTLEDNILSAAITPVIAVIEGTAIILMFGVMTGAVVHDPGLLLQSLEGEED